MSCIQEEWKPVLGFEGYYEASSLGRIMRVGDVWGRPVRRIIKPSIKKSGYCYVSLSAVDRRVDARVHVLVMAAFNGPRPVNCVINHIDADKTNNALLNLEYVTQQKNLEHSVALGRMGKGSLSGNAKLTESDVLTIRQLQGRISQVEIARRFGITNSAVSCIHTRKTWTHI
jgi:hypothetical protein